MGLRGQKCILDANGGPQIPRVGLGGQRRALKARCRAWEVSGRAWDVINRAREVTGKACEVTGRAWVVTGRDWEVTCRVWEDTCRAWRPKAGHSGQSRALDPRAKPRKPELDLGRQKGALEAEFCLSRDRLNHRTFREIIAPFVKLPRLS